MQSLAVALKEQQPQTSGDEKRSEDKIPGNHAVSAAAYSLRSDSDKVVPVPRWRPFPLPPPPLTAGVMPDREDEYNVLCKAMKIQRAFRKFRHAEWLRKRAERRQKLFVNAAIAAVSTTKKFTAERNSSSPLHRRENNASPPSSGSEVVSAELVTLEAMQARQIRMETEIKQLQYSQQQVLEALAKIHDSLNILKRRTLEGNLN